jgi:hypothetical protein
MKSFFFIRHSSKYIELKQNNFNGVRGTQNKNQVEIKNKNWTLTHSSSSEIVEL